VQHRTRVCGSGEALSAVCWCGGVATRKPMAQRDAKDVAARHRNAAKGGGDMTLATQRTNDFTLRCKHCAEPVEPAEDIGRYVHTDTDAVGCDVLDITSGRAEPDVERLLADATAALEDRYTLLYLDRSDDGLTPPQIQRLLDGTNEWESPEFSFIEEHESDMRRDAAAQVLRDLLDDQWYDLVERAARLDELRWEVEDRDDSGGLVALLLHASPHHLFRYDLGVDVPDYTVTSTEGDDTREVIANAAGLDLAHPVTAALVDELVANASYGGRLSVLWYGDPVDAVELAGPYGSDGEPGTVTFTDAHLLILDSWNGSGHTAAVPVMWAQWSPRQVSIDAPCTGRGYSWTDVAGPVASTYGGTCRVDRLKGHPRG
jgi:hypothetical protein